MKVTDAATIRHLKFLCKTYDATKKTITQTKNRLHHLNPDAAAEHDNTVKAMESIKNKLSRQIEKQLEYWPIWTEWLKKVPGCGPFVAGNLIILYYYRFIPICKKCGGDLIKDDGMYCSECGKAAKKDGVLEYRIDTDKRFDKVSSWWHYMGMHCDENGRKPKMKAGVVCTWSPVGRAVMWQFGDQCVRIKKSEYRKFLDMRKKKREKTHPNAKKGHRHNMARHETGKLFLSHFIQVAKDIEGEEFTKPYQHTVMGHTNFIEPFYWNPPKKERVARKPYTPELRV